METARNILHLDFDDLEIVRFFHILTKKTLRYTPNTLQKALKYEWVKIFPVKSLIFPEHIRTLFENFGIVKLEFIKKTRNRNSGLNVIPIHIKHKLCNNLIWPNKTPCYIFERFICENCEKVSKKDNSSKITYIRKIEMGIISEIKIAIFTVISAQSRNETFLTSFSRQEDQFHAILRNCSTYLEGYRKGFPITINEKIIDNIFCEFKREILFNKTIPLLLIEDTGLTKFIMTSANFETKNMVFYSKDLIY